jgi:hypothetical protein
MASRAKIKRNKPSKINKLAMAFRALRTRA